MAATVKIHAMHGAYPGTGTDITETHIRFKRADNDTVDTGDPVPIPNSGTNYSWRKSTQLRIESAPVVRIYNVKWFTTATALGAGLVHRVLAGSAYVQGQTVDETTSIGGADSTTVLVDSPLDVTQTPGANLCVSTDTFPTYGTSQLIIAQQISIASTASPGASTPKTMTYRYDEA